jgi:hypothetical protein
MLLQVQKRTIIATKPMSFNIAFPVTYLTASVRILPCAARRVQDRELIKISSGPFAGSLFKELLRLSRNARPKAEQAADDPPE